MRPKTVLEEVPITCGQCKWWMNLFRMLGHQSDDDVAWCGRTFEETSRSDGGCGEFKVTGDG